MKTPTPRYLGAPQSLAAGEGFVLADGTLWSHAAVLGARTKGGDQFTIGPAEVQNAVKVFTTGYPRKVPVDYEHGSTTNDPEIRKLRAAGGVPKAGDVVELKAVLSVEDFDGELKAVAEKLAKKAGRELDDTRNLGLWMRWKPTARALQAVKNEEYTELSIAFEEDVPNNTDGKGQGFGLYAVALLNRPFLDEMLPVAASRDTDPPPGIKPASREGTMKSLVHITALAALAGATVTSDEEAVTELPKILPRIKQGFEFTSVVAAEFGGETDPAKVVKTVRELRAENQTLKAAAETAKKDAAKATAEATIKQYEKAISSAPLREMFLRQLTGELEAGKKLDETETLKTIKSLPDAANLGRSAGVDVEGEGAADRDTQIERTAQELMASDATLKAMVNSGNRYEAYKQALSMADQKIRSVAAHAVSSTTAGPKGGLLPNTLIAGAAIDRGKVVKRGADLTHCIHAAAATDVSLGIAIDSQATAEKPVAIADRPGEIVEGRAGNSFALDALLTSDANGRLVTAASTNPVAAIARQAATAADQLVPVEIAPRGLKAP